MKTKVLLMSPAEALCKGLVPLSIFGRCLACIAAGLLLCGAGPRLIADQVEMQNGDRYAGKVLSLDANTLVLQSDVLGKVNLPRSRVALVLLGPNALTNASRLLSALTNQPRGSLSALRSRLELEGAAGAPGLAASTNSIGQIRDQFLSEAGPAANKKFNDMATGLMSGKLSVGDLRVQAKAVADQARALRQGLGDEAGGVVDNYLAILDEFLRETAPGAPGSAETNAVAR